MFDMPRQRARGVPLARGHKYAGVAFSTGGRERHEPTTMAVISVVATVAATAVSAYASYEQGQQQKKASKYSQRVAENQAIMARQAAEEAAEQREEHRDRVLGAARANIGASGLEATPGSSPLEVLAFDAYQGTKNAINARYAGETQAVGYQSQAGLYSFNAASYERAGYMGAGTTLLSGLGKAGNMAAGYYNRPPTGGYTAYDDIYGV